MILSQYTLRKTKYDPYNDFDYILGGYDILIKLENYNLGLA